MDSANKLWRRLRREVTRSPRKAGVLALLLVVALWFWMPLVTKWLSRGDAASPAAVADGAVQNTTIPVTSATVGGTQPNSTLTWKTMLALIKNDPYMRPQMPEAGGRNPFAPSAARRLAEEQAARGSVARSSGDITPEDAGLTLHSTAVGLARHTALINERVYREGQIVVGANDADRFELTRIGPRYVTLRRNGKEFTLKLRTIETAGLDE